MIPMEKKPNSKKSEFLLTAIIFLFSFQLQACSGVEAGDSNSESSPEPMMPADTYFALPDSTGEVYNSEEFDFQVQTVLDGLGIVWGMDFLPDGRVLVGEKDGDLYLVENGVRIEEPIGNVPEVYDRGQGGLMDVTLHPNFEENGWIYFSYSKPGPGGAMTSIMRAKYDHDTHALFDNEEIYTGQPFTDNGRHFGSRIVFDPNGYLFFSIGDRGNRPMAQDITTSNGNLFRLYDDGTVPEDNPFVGKEGLDEIYTYGLRNIQGMDVHPETGIIWTNEHGPRGGDELNVHHAGGLNFGWPEISYGINYDGTTFTDETERPGMEQPVTYWDPSIAPSGLAFVTSDRYPGWKGDVLNGALRFQLIARVVVDGTDFVKEERIVEGIGRIRDVVQAPDGYIYFSNESNGTVNRILPLD